MLLALGRVLARIPFALVTGDYGYAGTRLGDVSVIATIVRPISEWRYATIMALKERFNFSATRIGAARAVRIFFGLDFSQRTHSQHGHERCDDKALWLD
jgi:hypothetical protein